jgi:hypothetical protein
MRRVSFGTAESGLLLVSDVVLLPGETQNPASCDPLTGTMGMIMETMGMLMLSLMENMMKQMLMVMRTRTGMPGQEAIGQ